VTVALEFGTRTAVGNGHDVNEDAVGCDAERQLWLVADGMGGHAAGEVAGAMVRDRVLEEVQGGAELNAAIRAAHAAIMAAAAADPGRHGMGSTVVAVQVVDAAARVAWVGDSRVYLLRGGALSCLTRDHSLVQLLLEQGHISADQAAGHPDRNVLVRTLGFEDPAVDRADLELQPGDVLLLCSDGLCGELSDTEIRRILLAKTEPQAAADALIEAVVAQHGRDDASAVVIRHRPRDKLTPNLWLPVAGGIGLVLLVYLIWNWMRAS
jgi:protein phosphatase